MLDGSWRGSEYSTGVVKGVVEKRRMADESYERKAKRGTICLTAVLRQLREKAYANGSCERIKRGRNTCLTKAAKDVEAEKAYI